MGITALPVLLHHDHFMQVGVKSESLGCTATQDAMLGQNAVTESFFVLLRELV